MHKTFLICFLIITIQYKFLYKYLLLSEYFPIFFWGGGGGGENLIFLTFFFLKES